VGCYREAPSGQFMITDQRIFQVRPPMIGDAQKFALSGKNDER